MRDFFWGLGAMLIVGGIGIFLVKESMPSWRDDAIEGVEMILEESAKSPVQKSNWDKIREKLDKIPNFYPFSKFKTSVLEVPKIIEEVDKVKSINLNIGSLEEAEISKKEVLNIFNSINNIDQSLGNIDQNIKGIWNIFLTKPQQDLRDEKLVQLQGIRKKIKDIKNFENIVQKFFENKERVLLILQNENEPRSTGGFMGSMIVFDFSREKLTWKFQDIYALDRLVPNRVKKPAPDFFHNLDKVISLRDANFSPDFPTSAAEISELISHTGQESPDTIIAINTNLIEELLKITGPITLEKWGLILDQYNFDLGLEFLVESKVAGRYNVKSPVMIFTKKLVAAYQKVLKNDPQKVQSFGLKEFLAGKNLLANSREKNLQTLFSKWGIAGEVRQKRVADNFLQFDFVSVGANKSEKFIWTKIKHNSEISANGKVKNSLKIIRNHALRNGEISELLDTNLWSENIRELLTEEIFWKLGAGQNRTVLRITVPDSAKLLSQNNPSGEISQNKSEIGNFQVLEIPMFVSPGEKLNISLEYETQIEQGSHNWRPYFLQMVGTPAREKTSFLETITTKDNGKFSAETYNIGRPVDLIDQDFRAVVEF